MNNLKKIGLTALAGSLVAFSAQALEMSASGSAKIAYVDEGEGSVETQTLLVTRTVLIKLLHSVVLEIQISELLACHTF